MTAIAPWRAREALRLLELRLVLPLAFGRGGIRPFMEAMDARFGVTSPDPGRPPAVPATGRIDELERLVHRVFRPLRVWRTTCLWRALAGYATLRASGADVRLLIGVRAGRGGEVEAHAWLERGGRPSIGAPRPEDGYEVAFRWPEGPRSAPRAEEVDVPGLRRSDDAVLTELRDGTGVLLDLRSRFYFTLNRTGVLVWKLLGEGAPDVGAVASDVAARFPGVDPAGVRRDVEALLAELRSEGLVADAP